MPARSQARGRMGAGSRAHSQAGPGMETCLPKARELGWGTGSEHGLGHHGAAAAPQKHTHPMAVGVTKQEGTSASSTQAVIAGLL